MFQLSATVHPCPALISFAPRHDFQVINGAVLKFVENRRDEMTSEV
ncbi:hypothetical protein DFR33_11338 [Bradymonas sediminis]|nr:hypothetical protein DFR33_11338 [Bradymonas sediminis]